MKIRFGIDQKACFLAGVEAPHSTAVITIDAAVVPKSIQEFEGNGCKSGVSNEDRLLIGCRLNGIDVMRLEHVDDDIFVVSDKHMVRVPGDKYDDLIKHLKAEIEQARVFASEWPHGKDETKRVKVSVLTHEQVHYHFDGEPSFPAAFKASDRKKARKQRALEIESEKTKETEEADKSAEMAGA